MNIFHLKFNICFMISGEKYVMTLFDVLTFANQGKLYMSKFTTG